jgi:hypothetical protein
MRTQLGRALTTRAEQVGRRYQQLLGAQLLINNAPRCGLVVCHTLKLGEGRKVGVDATLVDSLDSIQRSLFFPVILCFFVLYLPLAC